MDDLIPLLLTLAASLAVQAVFFAVAATLRTDKVTDLSYGLTFVLLAAWLFLRHDPAARPQAVLAALVVLWGLRLAGYLFYRILRMGRDTRFDGVRDHFWKFLQFWFFQGVVVWAIMIPVTVWFGRPGPWNPAMTAGVLVWAAGLVIETVADRQKFRHKTAPGGRDRWVDTGLWRYSRHPNYFGELLCWWGVFLFVLPDLGWLAPVGLVGPLTITLVLLRLTGIPTLEQSAARKWGADPAYQAYRRRTRLLVPWPRGTA
ncbi:MAG: DUF1295 domain-containing protein [Vicinamibacterales bacterium]